MAGNRTRINCLEGNYAHHYTTIARLKTVLLHSLLMQYRQDRALVVEYSIIILSDYKDD